MSSSQEILNLVISEQATKKFIAEQDFIHVIDFDGWNVVVGSDHLEFKNCKQALEVAKHLIRWCIYG